VTTDLELQRLHTGLQIQSVEYFITVSNLVLGFIGIEIRIQMLSDHNDTICKKQLWRKCQITCPLPHSDQTSWDTNYTTPIQFHNSLLETSYVITPWRNINIAITRLFAILLRFRSVSSRFLLNSWHSNDPEPKAHLFLLESKPHLLSVHIDWCCF